MNINDFISSIDNKIYKRIRQSKSDAECRRYLKEHLEAITVTHCCKTVKEKCTHTFEVDLNNEQVQKQRCEYIEQIHALPTRLFMYNPKTDEYIELKP